MGHLPPHILNVVGSRECWALTVSVRVEVDIPNIPSHPLLQMLILPTAQCLSDVLASTIDMLLLALLVEAHVNPTHSSQQWDLHDWMIYSRALGKVRSLWLWLPSVGILSHLIPRMLE